MFAYFLCLNLLLFTRLVYLRNDYALGVRDSLWLAGLQIILIAVCFSFSPASWLLIVLVVAIFGLNLGFEAKYINVGWRFATFLMLLIGADLIQALTTGLQLRHGLQALVGLLVRESSIFVVLGVMSGATLMKTLFGFLLLTNEINVLIRMVFQAVGIEPTKARTKAIDVKEFNAGRVIGFLERWLIYLVVLSTNDLTAIGFIIAAKGLARMKQLEDKDFAEYMLIGTFLSVLSAILVGKWILVLFTMHN